MNVARNNIRDVASRRVNWGCLPWLHIRFSYGSWQIRSATIPRVTGQNTRRSFRPGSSAAGGSVGKVGEADELGGTPSL